MIKKPDSLSGAAIAPNPTYQPPDAKKSLENIDPAAQSVKEKAPPFRKGERHRIIASNIAGETPKELAAEFKAIAEQNPKISKPAIKISISADKKDQVTVAEWRQIGKGALKELGYGNSPFIIIQHRDREHDHIHILTSAVDVFGNKVNDSQSKIKLENFLRETEIKYGFEKTLSSQESRRAAPKRGELERFQEKGEISIKMRLQAKVDYAINKRQTVAAPVADAADAQVKQIPVKIPTEKFIDKLEKTGTLALPRFNDAGNVTGVSFWLNGKIMKGSSFGRGYSWNKLQEQGLDYQPERDNKLLFEVKEKTEKVIEEWRTQKAHEPQKAEIVNQITAETSNNKIESVKPEAFSHESIKSFREESAFVQIDKTSDAIAKGQSVETNHFDKSGFQDDEKSSALNLKQADNPDLQKLRLAHDELKSIEIASAMSQNHQPVGNFNPELNSQTAVFETSSFIINQPPVIGLPENQLPQSYEPVLSLLPDKPKQIELTTVPAPTAHLFAEQAGKDSEAIDEQLLREETDSYSPPKVEFRYDYDEANRFFWEHEAERINNQILEQQKEFVQTLIEQIQQTADNQSQILAQTLEQQQQSQMQLQATEDAVSSLNEIMFRDQSDTQIYQAFIRDCGSNETSKSITIESLNLVSLEEDELKAVVEVEPEEISSLQSNQQNEIDFDGEEYEEDYRDEFEQENVQVLSMF